MRGFLSCIAIVACALAIAVPAGAQTTETVKPYILLILDTSGSMAWHLNGSTSCVPGNSNGVCRIDHARRAIQNLVNTHGDAVFALARFRRDQTTASCNSCGSAYSCNRSVTSSEDFFELLVPLAEDNASSILSWVDFGCGSCGHNPTSNPEVYAQGGTPIAWSLQGAKRYLQGQDSFYATELQPHYATAPGDPIRNDPLKNVFLPGGEQCRPYIVIMLTDGEETCANFTNDTIPATAALLTTPVDSQSYRIRTRPIGFGRPEGDAQIEGLAHAGGAVDVPGQNEGFYAADEQGLSIAFNQIIAESVKVEVCNGLDDDCDLAIDEGYQKFCDKDNGVTAPTLCTDPTDD